MNIYMKRYISRVSTQIDSKCIWIRHVLNCSALYIGKNKGVFVCKFSEREILKFRAYLLNFLA